MANYFYFYTDVNGQKQGPANAQQLQGLAAKGMISPNMPIEIYADRKDQCEVHEESEFPLLNLHPPRKRVSRLVKCWDNIVSWLTKTNWFFYGIDFDQEENESSKTYGASMYFASPKKVFLESLKSLDMDNNDVDFLDVGCGKGYSLYLAKQFSFRTTSGIENTKKFVETCIRNLERLHTRDINVIFEDILNMKEKLDAYNVFYLFNPFPESTMMAFIDDLKSSLLRKSRETYLIYCSPCFFTTVEKTGFLRKKILAFPFDLDYMYVCIYTFERRYAVAV